MRGMSARRGSVGLTVPVEHVPMHDLDAFDAL